MLKFKNGLLLGTCMSQAGVVDTSGGSGGQQQQQQAPANNNAFLQSLPEPLRAHGAFKDVADMGALAQRYADTQKPFAEQLPEKIRGEAYFKDIKSFDDLATKAYNQAKMIGKDPNTLLEIPSNDDDKALTALYTKLGRPETADKYDIPKLADGKDYSTDDKAFQTAVLPILHDAGITQRQLTKIMPAWNALQAKAAEAVGAQTQASFKTADEALTKEWGAAKAEKIATAQAAITFLASGEKGPKLGADLKAALETINPATGQAFGNMPAFARLFAYFGTQMKEDGLIGKGGAGGVGDALSPAEADQQINAKYADTKFMASYTNKNAPDHADAVREMSRLFEAKTAKAAG